MADTTQKDSLLPGREQRFLSFVLDVARQPEIAILTREEIIQQIGCLGIMAGKVAAPGFRDSPERRAAVLGACGFGWRNRALAMSPEDAGHSLQDALNDGDTTLSQIFDAIGDDELVRTQNPEELWELLARKAWWKKNTPNAKIFMAISIEKVIIEDLLADSSGDEPKNTHFEIVKHIRIKNLTSRRVPVETIEQVFALALELGEAKEAKPLTAKRLLGKMGLERLIRDGVIGLEDAYRVLDAVVERYFKAKKPEAEKSADALDESRLTNRPPPPETASATEPVPPGDAPASEEAVPAAEAPPSDDAVIELGEEDAAPEVAAAAQAAKAASTGEGSGLNRLPQPPPALPIPGAAPAGPPRPRDRDRDRNRQ